MDDFFMKKEQQRKKRGFLYQLGTLLHLINSKSPARFYAGRSSTAD
jgi:hypothetical protein